MKTLIVGIARSGTSALYFKLKQALPTTTWCLFEPHSLDPSELDQWPDVLAKIVIGSPDTFDFAPFSGFENKIFIVRDPRDNLVSRLLYHPCAMAEIRENDAKVAAFVDALRGKEADPGSISVRELLVLAYRLSGRHQLDRATALQTWALDLHRNNGDFVVCKYEDFIAGRYDAIEKCLDIRLPPGQADLSAQYQHAVRTKSADGWRHWFTAEDVDYFHPRLAPFMAAYGYGDDWALAAEPRISAEHSSDFVRRSVDLRRSREPR